MAVGQGVSRESLQRLRACVQARLEGKVKPWQQGDLLDSKLYDAKEQRKEDNERHKFHLHQQQHHILAPELRTSKCTNLPTSSFYDLEQRPSSLLHQASVAPCIQ